MIRPPAHTSTTTWTEHRLLHCLVGFTTVAYQHTEAFDTNTTLSPIYNHHAITGKKWTYGFYSGMTKHILVLQHSMAFSTVLIFPKFSMMLWTLALHYQRNFQKQMKRYNQWGWTAWCLAKRKQQHPFLVIVSCCIQSHFDDQKS